jgi:maltose O-acetyltransferase
MRVVQSVFYRLCAWALGVRGVAYKSRARFAVYLRGGCLLWSVSARAEVPVRCDGSGKVCIGSYVTLGFRPAPRCGNGEILLQSRGADSSISIGEGTKLSNNIVIVAAKRISIGHKCLLGDNVYIIDTDAHPIDPVLRHTPPSEAAEVVVGNNVWLGSRVMVLKGSVIGDNSVVAAGAVVVGAIPSNVVAAGVPAKVIRTLNA